MIEKEEEEKRKKRREEASKEGRSSVTNSNVSYDIMLFLVGIFISRLKGRAFFLLSLFLFFFAIILLLLVISIAIPFREERGEKKRKGKQNTDLKTRRAVKKKSKLALCLSLYSPSITMRF